MLSALQIYQARGKISFPLSLSAEHNGTCWPPNQSRALYMRNILADPNAKMVATRSAFAYQRQTDVCSPKKKIKGEASEIRYVK